MALKTRLEPLLRTEESHHVVISCVKILPVRKVGQLLTAWSRSRAPMRSSMSLRYNSAGMQICAASLREASVLAAPCRILQGADCSVPVITIMGSQFCPFRPLATVMPDTLLIPTPCPGSTGLRNNHIPELELRPCLISLTTPTFRDLAHAMASTCNELPSSSYNSAIWPIQIRFYSTSVLVALVLCISTFAYLSPGSWVAIDWPTLWYLTGLFLMNEKVLFRCLEDRLTRVDCLFQLHVLQVSLWNFGSCHFASAVGHGG